MRNCIPIGTAAGFRVSPASSDTWALSKKTDDDPAKAVRGDCNHADDYGGGDEYLFGGHVHGEGRDDWPLHARNPDNSAGFSQDVRGGGEAPEKPLSLLSISPLFPHWEREIIMIGDTGVNGLNKK